MNFNNMEENTIQGQTTGFNYSAVRPDKLEEMEYTLVNIAIDISGSVNGFSKDLDAMLKSVVSACKKSPKQYNTMIRLITFNSNLNEVHGFVEVPGIDENTYEALRCGGMTALYDASTSSVSSITDYAQSLGNTDIDSNGILFVITDGMDNQSSETPIGVKEALTKAIESETLESLVSILIGVNTIDSSIKQYLDDFKNEAGFDQYIDMGEVTPQKLAKLAGFVSKSISSQSQSIGSGVSAKIDSLTF